MADAFPAEDVEHPSSSLEEQRWLEGHFQFATTFLECRLRGHCGCAAREMWKDAS